MILLYFIVALSILSNILLWVFIVDNVRIDNDYHENLYRYCKGLEHRVSVLETIEENRDTQ